MSVTTSNINYRTGYEPMVPGVYFAPYPAAFEHGDDEAAATDAAIRAIRQLFATTVAASQVAAILIEPVQGEGGVNPATPGFLAAAAELAAEHGALLCFDEVQTGVGRTGTFFAFEQLGIQPDLLTLANKLGQAAGEPLLVHKVGNRARRRKTVQELLEVVGFNPDFVNRYPHEFSGGQRQHIGIARALALNPRLIVCDEPVSALDVSIQAQILNLLKDLQGEFGLTYLFVAHDLAVVRTMSDDIAVMNKGKIVEAGAAERVYTQPQDEYTKALLAAVPVPDPHRMRERKEERRKHKHALAEAL